MVYRKALIRPESYYSYHLPTPQRAGGSPLLISPPAHSKFHSPSYQFNSTLTVSSFFTPGASRTRTLTCVNLNIGENLDQGGLGLARYLFKLTCAAISGRSKPGIVPDMEKARHIYRVPDAVGAYFRQVRVEVDCSIIQTINVGYMRLA